jgi:hypothetical protein
MSSQTGGPLTRGACAIEEGVSMLAPVIDVIFVVPGVSNVQVVAVVQTVACFSRRHIRNVRLFFRGDLTGYNKETSSVSTHPRFLDSDR